MANFLPLVLIALVFWLLLVRPARKRQKEFTAVQQAIEPGREIMTASGIFGTVTGVVDDRLQVEIAPGVTIEILRQAVGRVVDDPAEEPYEHRTSDDDVDGRTD
ncbi:preprotein translocase, YajC subunit [Aeromicrobium marinum DSM 15272]|uniref:Preprotein translocase, YajC subunit n=1 Tax=Aeromicrobium marinum DSM 15272 TaxID=585531 RepID=E2S9E4_9ACTN|nr:preprotein translocase, YajC subunit [Aeromicrobium marinum DSM 15272]